MTRLPLDMRSASLIIEETPSASVFRTALHARKDEQFQLVSWDVLLDVFPAVKVVLSREEFDSPYDETIVENLLKLCPGHTILVRCNLERVWSKPVWDKRSDRPWAEYRTEALEFLDEDENNKIIPLFRTASESWEQISSRVKSEQERR